MPKPEKAPKAAHRSAPKGSERLEKLIAEAESAGHLSRYNKEFLRWLEKKLPGFIAKKPSWSVGLTAVSPRGVIHFASLGEPGRASCKIRLKKFHIEGCTIPREFWGNGMRPRRDGYYLTGSISPKDAASLAVCHFEDLQARAALEEKFFGD